MSERDPDKCVPWPWHRVHGYSHLYVGEKYISMYYYRGGYEGEMRDWNESLPLSFDRETELMLYMDDLFTVEESIYKKRLTGSIYKYCEMKGMKLWQGSPAALALRFLMNGLRIYLSSRHGEALVSF